MANLLCIPSAWSISPLESHHADAETISQWILEEWGPLPIHEYLHAIAAGGQAEAVLPRTLVAHVDRVVIGTVSVLRDDLETRPEFNPWLGCLYVVPKWRRRGLGVALLRAGEALAARKLDLGKLYLFTESQAALYSRNGWLIVGFDEYRGKSITIMTKDVGEGERMLD